MNRQKQLLDRLYFELNRVILSRQHPLTGLLPASTAVNEHGNYNDAWVRDNVYSVVSVWSLSMALKRVGETHRADHLEQATIKLMRGLMQAMMRQADKVEKFKSTFSANDCLHAKYDTATGLPVVADDAWGHLQLDATSLFLLMLAQMTSSGLRIVFSLSEVDFIQNLVYYISSAYRIPDFGIWERGNKINNGQREVNASSVGMAKAALQALDGFNLFGPTGNPRATIHVVIDSISLARTTIASLLPRESVSKEVDAALLSVIGFPAFAVGDKALVDETRHEITSKLAGKYGCKRFLWDGHQTVLEEKSRMYYDHSELANFEDVESEWPLFYTYFLLNSIFSDDRESAEKYREHLQKLTVDQDGIDLLPELYYLEKEHIEAEKNEPHSQPRVPNENVPLVWAQSLYMTGTLLMEGLLQVSDIDPLKMHKRSRAYYDPQVALVILAKNDRVKQSLSDGGVLSETLDEVKPLSVLSALDLMDIYHRVGENKQLGLTGRPKRRLQSLVTSRTYTVNGKVCLALSWLQSETNDYRMMDAQLLSNVIEQEVSYIRKHWMSNNVAVFTLLVDDTMCDMPNAYVFFNALRDMQLRSKGNDIGYASAKLAQRASSVSHLKIADYQIDPAKSRLSIYEKIDPLSDAAWQNFSEEHSLGNLLTDATCDDFDQYQRWVDIVTKMEEENKSVDAKNIEVLCPDSGGGKTITISLKQLFKYVYTNAIKNNHWLLTRFCFAKLGYYHTDLADCSNLLAAKNLVISFGSNNSSETLNAAVTNEALNDIIKRTSNDPIEQTLLQEILSIIGSEIRYAPEIFNGLRSINLNNLLMLCLENIDGEDTMSKMELIGFQSPDSLMQRLKYILNKQREMFSKNVHLTSPYVQGESESFSETDAMTANAVNASWFEWRLARGSITRLEDEFLQDLWKSLAHAKKLVFGDTDSLVLDCEWVQSSMTSGEESFAKLIDGITQQLHPAYYKSAVVEALFSYIDFCQKNKDVFFEKPLMFTHILDESAKRYVEDNQNDVSEGRAMDTLMEQAPNVLHSYVTSVLKTLAT